MPSRKKAQRTEESFLANEILFYTQKKRLQSLLLRLEDLFLLC